jgi:thiol:disulfide interchange protein DsbA
MELKYMKIAIKSILLATLLSCSVVMYAHNPAVTTPMPATTSLYQPVATNVQANQDVKDFYQAYCNKQPTVVEFFSYACPGCSAVEPDFKRYLESKPQNVVFIRVPVVFNAGWDLAAKMYYTHEKLGVSEQLHDLTFAWTQQMIRQRKVLTHKDIEEFITRTLTLPAVADKITNKFTVAEYMEIMDSTMVNRDNKNAMRLLTAYGITSTPSVVVNNKYIVTLEQAKSMSNLLNTVNKLTAENTSC